VDCLWAGGLDGLNGAVELRLAYSSTSPEQRPAPRASLEAAVDALAFHRPPVCFEVPFAPQSARQMGSGGGGDGGGGVGGGDTVAEPVRLHHWQGSDVVKTRSVADSEAVYVLG
jgi:hypothetical protein